MAPPRGIKRKSDESVSAGDQVENTQDMTGATRTGSPSVAQEGPRKRQRTGITLSQKQALIDNLQLEIADRARKLRAQYNLQAQGLRTRIEIRVNRIPMALRKARMGELADKSRNGQHSQQPKPTPSAFSTSVSLPPPVPEKDTPVARQTSQATSHTTASESKPERPPKQASDQALRTNKENLGKTIESEPVKKKQRGNPAPEAEPTKTSSVLSPSSANVRTLPRTTPGGKSLVSRPGASTMAGPASPVKQSSAANLFSNLAEKARSTRPGASPRKQTASTSTTASSAGGSARGRNAATAAGAGTIKGASTTNPTRRASIVSESSEASTSTAVKKGTTNSANSAADKEMAPPMSTKKSVMGSIRRGVTGGASKKTTAAKTAAPASTATGRVLRKRA